MKLLKRKEEILGILEERNFLDSKIKNNISSAKTLQILEDIYSPFKDKKSSRTSNAIKNGLEPLANIIQNYAFFFRRSKSKNKINF